MSPPRAVTRTLATLALALLAALVAAVPASGQASWRLEQPDPPPGATFRIPLGAPGDLQFYAPNRGLLAIEGNAAVARGLYTWNGVRWSQLSTVCGGTADTTRIAWAGPSEFWTITSPSRPRVGNGTSLCRFLDGRVVASYSTPDESDDPYRPMNAAVCVAADNCWFGGFGSQDATGNRVGAFHLHWNGAVLETVYGPQGRGVSDMEFYAGQLFESTFVGRNAGNAVDPVDLSQPESPKPRLIHRIFGTTFQNDAFVPADRAGVPADGTELLALDSDGSNLWAAGGGAASGPAATGGTSVPRDPIALRSDGSAFQEQALTGAVFEADDRFVDIAAVPGTNDAYAAVQPYSDRATTNVRARVARITPGAGNTSTVALTTLPAGGSGRGAAAKIAFTGPNDGWMVTNAGWLFHYTDGTAQAEDTNPAFSTLITARPNESVAQFVSDRPPNDDSNLFAQPPVTVQTQTPAATTPATKRKRLSPVLKNVKSKRRGSRLTVSFTLVRTARVGLVGKRKGKVVARAKAKSLRPGKRSITIRLSRRRFPTKLAFTVKERGQSDDGGGGVDNGDLTTRNPR